MSKMYSAGIASGIAAAALIIIGMGVASAQSVAFPSEIGIGAQGTEVTSLQTWLENAGYYSGPVTGYYGVLTKGGVENFQSANGISATGYVGPLTLAALNAKASGTTTVSSNPTLLAQLETELNSLLAQIQALGGTTITTTTSGVPTAANLTFQTNENVGENGTITNVSGTGPFTYTIVNNPLNGTITSFNSQTGAFTYAPNANYVGNDTFTYRVSNAYGASAPMTVTISVGSTSAGVPTGQGFSFSTQNSVAYSGNLSASGSGPYTYSINSEPSHGTISNFNSSTGAFTYTPTANYTGSDTFTYTVSNNAGVSSPVTVTINDGTSSAGAPTGRTLSFATANGAALNGMLSASGTGPYNFAIATNPSWGTIDNFSASTGAFTYVPNSGYTGNDSFTYVVGNATATSSPYTVNISD
jgi:peptidoglycan hydrolase-like protein with peptidoglycan-binding domain